MADVFYGLNGGGDPGVSAVGVEVSEVGGVACHFSRLNMMRNYGCPVLSPRGLARNAGRLQKKGIPSPAINCHIEAVPLQLKTNFSLLNLWLLLELCQ